MRGPAVDLYREPSRRPEEVHLFATDHRVHQGQREFPLIEQFQKPRLQLVASGCSGDFEKPAQVPRAAAAARAIKHLDDRSDIEQPHDLRFVNRALQGPSVYDGSEVDQRPRDRCDGDAATGRKINKGKVTGLVKADGSPRPPAPLGEQYVDTRGRWSEAPQGRGAAVADDPACPEDGSEQPPIGR